MSDPSNEPGGITPVNDPATRVDEEPPDAEGGPVDTEMNASDRTGVDAQESITRGDASNVDFHDRVPEDPSH